jgi:ubiquinone/menaquinone biosynthesis C-methylase UbiE
MVASLDTGPGQAWRDLDTATNQRELLEFLDAFATLPAVAAAKRRSFELLDSRPGARFLDAGCGTGGDVAGLVTRVQPGGLVVGVDASEAALAVARLVPGGRFCRADLTALPFPDAWFDGARCDRTLQHIPSPQQAIAELVRVITPGGRLVITEATVRGPDQGVMGREGGKGVVAFLPLLLHRAGVVDVVIEAADIVVDDAGPSVRGVLGQSAGPISVHIVHVAGTVG